MEEQKVKDLSTAQTPKATDFVMLITNLTNNVLEKCQITALRDILFGDVISEDEGNALITGSDDKLYVPEPDLSNCANITLSNVTNLSNEIKALLSNAYAEKDLANVTSLSDEFLTVLKPIASNISAPDWNNKVDKSWDTQYTANSNGYLYFYSYNATNYATTLYINNVQYYYGGNIIACRHCVPIAKGDVYKLSGGYQPHLYFIPTKGGN